jgi:hypothetical protein
MSGKNGSSLSNLVLKIAGAACMAAGLATVWLPIPTGLILMVIGLTLLIASSPTIAAWARLVRRRNPGLDEKLKRAEPYLPQQMQRVLAKTKPVKTKPEPAADAQPPQPAKTVEPPKTLEVPKTPGFVAGAGGRAEAS